MIDAIHIHPGDNVAVATHTLATDTTVPVGSASVHLTAAITKGHKFAIKDIPENAAIVKFGEAIGYASTPIAIGEHVHTHNVKTNLAGHNEYRYEPGSEGESATTTSADAFAGSLKEKTFDGFRRADGRVGIRNEIWILVTVGCVNRLAQRLAYSLSPDELGNVDGVHAFPHPFGCSQTGTDMENTRQLLTSLCSHPNAGGVLILSLGCETNKLDAILDAIPENRRDRVRHLRCQQSSDEYADGLSLLHELIDLASADTREPCPVADLSLGMKCGGSDGFSGVTANAVVGTVADSLTAADGQVLLTEVPEMFGAEHLLMNRASSKTVFDKIVTLITDFKDYYLRSGESIAENPSPGNIHGGITTLEEKSLGAIQKGGRSEVTDVFGYGEIAPSRGLVLLNSPGNDAVSTTALTAAGAAMVLFTTGRGTPLAPPVPTLKIASNTDLAERKPDWIDFDAGRLLSGSSLSSVHEELIQQILDTASGKYETASERNDQREIAIWKTGVTL